MNGKPKTEPQDVAIKDRQGGERDLAPTPPPPAPDRQGGMIGEGGERQEPPREGGMGSEG